MGEVNDNRAEAHRFGDGISVRVHAAPDKRQRIATRAAQALLEPGERLRFDYISASHGYCFKVTLGQAEACVHCGAEVITDHPTLGGVCRVGEPPEGGQFPPCTNPTGQGHEVS